MTIEMLKQCREVKASVLTTSSENTLKFGLDGQAVDL